MGTAMRTLALQDPALQQQLLKAPGLQDAYEAVDYSNWSLPAQHSQPSLLQPVRGMVFDSCPARLTPDIAARCDHSKALKGVLPHL